MRRQIGTILIAALVMLSSILPGHVRAAQPAQTAPDVWLQGEIAYVRDGDIWLLDLTSSESTQLTTDGDNRWPAWSSDGRALLYTHARGPEAFDLYILEVGRGEPRLLAADACCAAWEADREYVIYISLAGNELALEEVRGDGSGKERFPAPLVYGRSSWPTGNIFWLQEFEWLQESELFVPLEVVTGSARGGLSTYADIFEFGEDLRPTFNESENPDCSWFHPTSSVESKQAKQSAVAFVGSTDCEPATLFATPSRPVALPADCVGCKPLNLNPATLTVGRSTLVWDAEDDVLHELPWLAYPSFSPDGLYLAAERYKPADEPTDAELWGLILHNLSNDQETPLVEGGSQPAWRPAPPVDPAAAHYAQPGERVVTVEPTLRYQGAEYRVHYYATGDYRSPSPRLFAVATPDFFESQAITGLAVTRDGRVVRDAETLRRVFTLYTAAYHLYAGPPDVPIPEYAEELGKIIGNPLLLAFEPEQLFASRHDQTAEALRGLLTDQLSAAAKTQALFEQLFQDDPQRIEDALEAFNAIAQDQAAQDALLGTLSDDLAQVYANLDTTVAWSGRASKLMRLAVKLLFVSHLQRERADWLAAYLDAFPAGDGSFDRDQIRAAATALDEVESAFGQRANIVVDFVADEATETLVELGGEAARQTAAQLMAKVGEKYGLQLSAHAVASTLSAVSIGLTVNGILYGTDALYDNFVLAQRAEELRHTFRAGRLALQAQAAAGAPVYDGDLAERFRAAYLLEGLTAVGSQRAYAEGVAAATRLPNPLDLLNWLRGQDREAAVQELHELADRAERDVLEEVGAPAYVDAAVERIRPRVETVVGIPDPAEFPVLHPDWTSYTNANYVTDLLVQGDTVWATTRGGAVRWDVRTGEYVKITSEYGLAHNDLNAIAAGPDGALWFGTADGVIRLGPDGRWETFVEAVGTDGLASDAVGFHPDTLISETVALPEIPPVSEWVPELTSSEFKTIAVAPDGELWFAMSQGGIIRLVPGGRWQIFFLEYESGRDISISDIAVAPDEAVWFGSESGAIRLGSDGRWQSFTTEDGLADNLVLSVAVGPDGALWFGTGDGVSRLGTDGRWTTFTTQDGLAGNAVLDIAVAPDGSAWFAAFDPESEEGRGVSRRGPDGAWRTFTDEDGLPDNDVWSMVVGPDGALWFGTGDGVSRLRADGRWTIFTTQDGLTDNDIWSMAVGPDGVLWFGSESGVSRLGTDGRWTTFTTEDGLASNDVHSIAVGPDGTLWFGTWGGVSRLGADGRWTTYTTDDGLAGNGVRSVAVGPDGTLWFGTWGGGVSRLGTDGRWTTFTTQDGLAYNLVQAMAAGSDGSAWFAALDSKSGEGRGVSRLGADGRWTTFTSEDGLAGDWVLSMAVGPDGALWFGTSGFGVSRLGADGRWATYTTDDGLANNDIEAIAVGPDGTLWFGTRGGVSRLGADGRWTTFTTADGLADNDVLSIVQDEEGGLWFGTEGGVSRYRPLDK